MLYSLRIGGQDHTKPEYIKRLTAALTECGGVFDEVWLATNYGFLSVEEHAECAKGMKNCAAAFDKIGIKPSLQISRTIGHAPEILTDYGAAGLEGLNVPNVKYLNGDLFLGRFCWNNKNFKKYTAAFLREYAKNIGFVPAVIWVDDDVRIRPPYKNGHSLCFCESCLDAYAKVCGKRYSFEEFREEFMKSDEKRRAYIDFQTQSLAEFSRIIAQEMLSVTKDPTMALQATVTTEIAAESTRRIFDVFEEVSAKGVGVRAGASFYFDHDPRGMLRKALGINYCISRMGENVKLKNCEIENLPFVSYGKSVECPALEASLYIAYGCNMASVTLMNEYEPLDYHKEIFKKLMLYKPYLKKFIEKTESTHVGGLSIFRTMSAYPRADELSTYEWDEDSEADEDARQLLRLGIPVNQEPNANVYILTERAAKTLTENDVDFLLTHPVLTDAKALLQLYKMGYADKIGIELAPLDCKGLSGVSERTVPHVANTGINYLAWSDSTYVSRDIPYTVFASEMEPITEFRAKGSDTSLGVAMCAVKMKSGIKWLIKGAHLYNPMISLEKKLQLVNAINYISEKPLPAYTSSFGQALVVPRVNSDGKTVSVTVLNVSISDIEDLKITVNNPKANTYTVCDPYSEDTHGVLEKRDDGYVADAGILRPWRTKTLFFN